MRCLSDKHAEVRKSAATALRYLGNTATDKHAIRQANGVLELKALLSSDSDAEVREAAQCTLEILEPDSCCVM